MKIGFIGTGNMGTAIIKGCIAADQTMSKRIYAADIDQEQLKKKMSNLDINLCTSNEELVSNCEVIVLAVKPHQYDRVLSEVKFLISDRHIVVSIAPGISIKRIESAVEKSVKVVRTMPNTPAMINEGITAISRNSKVTDVEFESIQEIFRGVGKTEVIDEKLMDVIPGISASSPAYVFMFIEALADGAVLHGMPREQAYRFAAQAVLGSAKLALESAEHPGHLKDMVCSPGGTTIEAVKSLEKNGFRFSVIEAVDACTLKAKKLAQYSDT